MRYVSCNVGPFGVCLADQTLLTRPPNMDALDFLDFKASVCVDGKPLPIFQPEYDHDAKTATCWIASEAGKAYTLRWTRENDVGSDVVGRVHLDGSHKAARSPLMDRDGSKIAEATGTLVANSLERPFLFANLATSGELPYGLLRSKRSYLRLHR